jgi:branched-chain amino acid aminotransferase
MDTIWCNGRLCGADESVVSVLDGGLRFGLGVFETIFCLEGRPVAWDRHMARMAASAARFGISAPDAEELRAALDAVVEAGGLGGGRLRARIGLTAGAGALDLAGGEGGIAWVEAARHDPPPATAAVALCPWTRNERDPLAGHKCASYAGNVVAMDWAKKHGLDEPLFANSRGELCEGATSNVFFALDGIVRTPLVSTGCLPGVTRGVVLELARACGVPVEEGEFASGHIAEATEVFLASSLRGVQPVRRCGARDLPAPGPLTTRLMAAYDEWLREEVAR